MSLMKYKDVLALCKEKIDMMMVPLRVSQMRKEGELEICKIDLEIAAQEQHIQEHTSEFPIDFNCIIESLDELELLKRRKEQFEKVIAELFGE